MAWDGFSSVGVTVAQVAPPRGWRWCGAAPDLWGRQRCGVAPLCRGGGIVEWPLLIGEERHRCLDFWDGIGVGLLGWRRRWRMASGLVVADGVEGRGTRVSDLGNLVARVSDLVNGTRVSGPRAGYI